MAETCCPDEDVSHMTFQLAGIMLDKFSQQAESLNYASRRIRSVYSQLIENTRTEFSDLFTHAYKKLFTKNRDLVDQFMDDLEITFDDASQPKKAFDNFFGNILVRYYTVTRQMEYKSLSPVEAECLNQAAAEVLNSQDFIEHKREKNKLLRKFEESFKPLKHLLVTLEDVADFLKSLNEENLLATARCMAPTRYCGPCTNQKHSYYRNECEQIHETLCFDWLSGWPSLVEFIEDDINSEKNIQKTFKVLPEDMSFAMQNLITNSEKSFVSLMSQKCTISDISSNSKRSTETIRPKSERSTFRSLHFGTSRHIQSQFTQDLLQASTKAKNLKSAIVKSVCYGLPEEKSLGNHTRHAAKGMPQISLTASDRLTNQILKEDLNKIVRKVRDARKNEKSTGLSDDEDFEGSSEFSGDTDDEIFDQSDSQQTILKTTVQVSTEATTERLPITKDRYKDQTSLLPQEKKFVKSSEKMSSSAIQMVFSILSIVLVLL